ncbi:2-amino-3-ketobutyrate coenzyme A ligase [Marinomonas sp. MED121]|nr:2-amino-3-ketobutyrate coenzyme A ligase [Marinomonas sp. MED121]
MDILETIEKSNQARIQLAANSQHFRKRMTEIGFTLTPGDHPIIPIMLGDARLAQDMAAKMFKRGVYVTGFSYPVVPMGQARIRTQMSAKMTIAELDTAIDAFEQVGHELKILG